MVKLKELKIQLFFYAWLLVFDFPNRISVPVMSNDYPVYFWMSLPKG